MRAKLVLCAVSLGAVLLAQPAWQLRTICTTTHVAGRTEPALGAVQGRPVRAAVPVLRFTCEFAGVEGGSLFCYDTGRRDPGSTGGSTAMERWSSLSACTRRRVFGEVEGGNLYCYDVWDAGPCSTGAVPERSLVQSFEVFDQSLTFARAQGGNLYCYDSWQAGPRSTGSCTGTASCSSLRRLQRVSNLRAPVGTTCTATACSRRSEPDLDAV